MRPAVSQEAPEGGSLARRQRWHAPPPRRGVLYVKGGRVCDEYDEGRGRATALAARAASVGLWDLRGVANAAEALALNNDHDATPLYFQFSDKQEGKFTREYLEQGPEVRRVRIGKAAG